MNYYTTHYGNLIYKFPHSNPVNRTFHACLGGVGLANRKCLFTRYCRCLDSLHCLGSEEKPIIDSVEPTCREAPMSTMLFPTLGFRV